MRRNAAIGAMALALSAQQHAYGGDGGTEGVDHEKVDGGAPRDAPRPTRLAGTFLGVLPLTPASDQRANSDPEREYPLKRRANGNLVYEAPQFSAEVAPDGTVRFHDRRLQYSPSQTTFSFDLFDEFVHHLAHGTLYPYEKASFLTATFKRRTAMAEKWYARQIRAAGQDLPRRLDALWADTRYRRRERRRIICLLWEDVDTSAPGATNAATTIVGWVRKRLPRGSSDAYTDDELDACSRERAGAPAFSPYEVSPDVGNLSQ